MLEDLPEPDDRDASKLVEAIAVSVCGTDVKIWKGKYDWAPPRYDAPRARRRAKRTTAKIVPLPQDATRQPHVTVSSSRRVPFSVSEFKVPKTRENGTRLRHAH